MDYITYDDFKKVDIRVGTILKAEVPEGSKKLIKLTIDFGSSEVEGEAGLGERVIFSGILEWFKPDELIGLQTTFVVNLTPRKMGSFGDSNGMLFAADVMVDGKSRPALVHFDTPLINGARMI